METRPYHNIGTFQSFKKAVDIGRIMLAVRINLDDAGIPMSPCEEERGSHRAAHPNIERKTDDLGSGAARDFRSGICRSVVHDQYISIGTMLTNFGDHVRYRAFLIPRWNGYQITGSSHKSTLSDQARRDGRSTGEYFAMT